LRKVIKEKMEGKNNEKTKNNVTRSSDNQEWQRKTWTAEKWLNAQKIGVVKRQPA